MSYLVPLETLQALKCSLCNEFLTVPPIMTTSLDGLQHKCGRCQQVPTDISIRNTIYEKIASRSTYPCTFPNCKEILTWDDVLNHEFCCSYRKLKCPVSWSCKETLSINELKEHCSGIHKKNVFNDPLLVTFDEPLDLEKSKITAMLLIHQNQNIPFLVFKVITIESIWIKVFSFVPLEKCRYEFDICSSAGKCCLSYKNPVEVFDERRHCKSCIMNDCTNILHDTNKKKIDETLANNGFQNISKSMVIQLQLIDLKLKIVFDK